MTQTKVCKGCGLEFELHMFSPAKRNRDGLENKCKDCRKNDRKKHTLTCSICTIAFKSSNSNARCCSNKCRGISERKRVEVDCGYCGKGIERILSSLSTKKYYCDKKCFNADLRTRMKGKQNHNYSKKTISCDYCGQMFERIPSIINKFSKHFCSNQCRGSAQKNTSQTTQNRIQVKCDTCGKHFEKKESVFNKSRNHFCSIKCHAKGKSIHYSGANHPRWDDTRSDEERIMNRNIPGYLEWRRSVFQRDNYTCICCGDCRGGNLVAHHKNSYNKYPEQRVEVENGVTLCETCHLDFHSQFGYGDNTFIQFGDWLKNKVVFATAS